MVWTLFEYLYRDAGNFKAFGFVALEGSLTPNQEVEICSKLEAGEYFIAEQVDVPPLYDQLYQWSDGPIATDHCWHEFIGFRNAQGRDEGGKGTVTAVEFVERFASVGEWDGSLSPHFHLD